MQGCQEGLGNWVGSGRQPFGILKDLSQWALKCLDVYLVADCGEGEAKIRAILCACCSIQSLLLVGFLMSQMKTVAMITSQQILSKHLF